MFLIPLLLPLALQFQNAPSGYKLPPKEIVDILDARPTPSARFSPDGKWIALLERPAMPSIEAVMRPWLGLAGLRIDPKTNAAKVDDFTDKLTIRDLDGSTSFDPNLAAPLKLINLSWSPKNDRFLATLHRGDNIQLVTFELASKKIARCELPLNTLFVGPRWFSDGRTILLAVIPKDRGAMPEEPAVPFGPSIQETNGEKSPIRTYEDLLKTPHDEALLDYCATSQLATFDSDSGKTELIGKPGHFAGADSSPDAQHVLVVQLEHPYTYMQPVAAFPRTYEIWNRAGKLEKSVAKIPLEENVPIEGVRTGPRGIMWQSSADATLVWWEALDGGDPKQKAEFRDRLMTLAAPFQANTDAREALKLEQRARGLTWFADPNLVAAGDFDRDRRWTRTRLFDLKDGKSQLVLDDRSQNDRYHNPGNIVLDENARGERVVRQDGDFVYRMGDGDSKQGARPFLDRFDLKSQKTERLWQCAEKTYESLTSLIDSGKDKKPTVVTSFETPEVAPNYFRKDLETGTSKQLTDFKDPQPQLRGITKELVTYKRKDGVELSATLYLPKGYSGGKLPVFVWAYPLEFSDAATAGQVSGSPYRFTRVSGASHLLLLTQGYAVLDNATMPIVGNPETMNDTFIEQIVSSAEACLDEFDRRGVCDKNRAAVGGHSYGAFMTANLLAHCDLFRAGIARSGAYNRTLTPFGFQSERRTFWEAKNIYENLSPFMFADKINEPLLMIHGMADSNPGTFPINSERLFQAIKGLGGKARFVYLPGEDHGYRARESNLHVLAEMVEWLDKYVKNAAPRG